MRWHHFHMALFPALEALCFTAAALALPDAPGRAVLFGIGGAVALNFSLHITYHYHVHFKSGVPALDTGAQWLFSVLMGLPFHYYQMLHINHHIHDNGPGDFTSTWKESGGRLARRNVLIYSCLWPFRGRGRHQIAAALEAGYMKPEHVKKLRQQGAVILAFVAGLAFVDWRLVVLYYGIFYLGWSLISLHNYGQHLPLDGELEIGNSFYSRLYNRLFVNNGLHFEHHAEPRLPYWELRDRRDENTNNEWPHTVDGVRFGVAVQDDPEPEARA